MASDILLSFERSMEEAPGCLHSEALAIVQYAIDPETAGHDDEYPPALTPADYVDALADNDDPLDDLEALTDRTHRRLIMWAGQGAFEVVGVMANTTGDPLNTILFRITPDGLQKALSVIKAKSTRLRTLARKAEEEAALAASKPRNF